MKKSEYKFEKDPEMKIESFVRHTELILDMFLCLKNETNLTFPEMPTMFEKNVAHIVSIKREFESNSFRILHGTRSKNNFQTMPCLF